MDTKWPRLLQFLNAELGYAVREGNPALGYQLYTLDLSAWKLRLTNRTPVVWIQTADLEGMTPRDLMQSLADVVRERNLGRQIVLVLVDGNTEPLFRHKTGLVHNMVLIGAEEQKEIQRSRRPSGELLDMISAQIPISNLSPYETRTPVTGSRFFGREAEINRLLSSTESNHAILGIRRIGKTSLLREIERVLKEEQNLAHVIYLECSDLLSTDDYVREVVRKLNPRELPRVHMQKYVFFFPDFLERMSRFYKSKIIFLLDEVDNLVVMQRGDWELFRMLRASANKGACQYILAGFREAMKEQNLLDSPFYNFAQEIRLSEFSRQQAHNLIVTPMENLRVHIRSQEEVVGRIFEETAGHPNLIQYYCTILLRSLDQSGSREITPDSLTEVYNDEGFNSHLLAGFMQNTENREKALVYVLLKNLETERQGFSLEHIDDSLRQGGLELLLEDIDEACQVLTLAGILHRKGKEFHFRSPVFTKVLRQSYDLDFLFRKVKEEGL